MPIEVSESQVRRLAARNSLQLSKVRRNNQYSDEARYCVTDPYCSNGLLTSEFGVDLHDAKELIEDRKVTG